MISRLALAAIISALTTSMPPDIGDVRLIVPDADWRVLLFLIAGAGVATIAFALAPALHATRIEPIRTLRGDGVGDARPGRARNVLIGLQVSASALLLISAGVFLRSAFAAATYDSGVRTADTLAVQVVHEPNRHAIVQAVTSDPAVVAVAASWPDLALRSGVAESGGARTRIAYKFVSPDFFSVLDIRVVRGRAFAPEENAPNRAVVIVSETAARAMWANADPVGQVIHLDADQTSEPPRADEPSLVSQTFTVAGVVRDVAGLRIMPLSPAVVYVPTSAETIKTSLIARVRGNPELARQNLLNRLTAVDPDMARQVTTLRTLARLDTYFLQVGFWLTIVLGALALTLTVSGLFSVLSYLVEHRAKEIGVRMALGATTRNVTWLILSQSVRPVGVGLLIGGGLSAGVAGVLLATPAAAGIGAIVHVFDPVAYAMSLLVIIAACVLAASIPAARAARLDPALPLRQD